MINYLKGKTVYLAGHIASAEDSLIVKWREELTPKLLELGLNIKDPTLKPPTVAGEIGEEKLLFKRLIKERKFAECKEKFWPVMRYDLRSVDLSDFLIVNFLPRVPTVGTIDEILTASRYQKKPVLIFVNSADLDYLNPWLLCLVKANWIFTSWDDLLNYLKEIDKGNIDSSRWTL